MGKTHLIDDANKAVKVKRPYIIDENHVAHKGKKMYYVDENRVAHKVFSGGEVSLKGYYPNYMTELGWMAAGSANDKYAIFAGGRTTLTGAVTAIDDNMTAINADKLTSTRCAFDGFQIGKYAFFTNGVNGSYANIADADAYDENLVHISLTAPYSTGSRRCDIFNGVLGVTAGRNFYTVDENLTIRGYSDLIRVSSSSTSFNNRAICCNAEYCIIAGGESGGSLYKYVQAINKDWTVSRLDELSEARQTDSDRTYSSHPSCATAWGYVWDTALVRQFTAIGNYRGGTRQTIEDNVIVIGGSGITNKVGVFDVTTYTYTYASFRIGGMSDTDNLQDAASCKRKGKMYVAKGYLNSNTNYYKDLNVLEV